MKLLPEEPQPLAAQLRQMPAYQAMLSPDPELEPVPLTAGRIAAGLMQLKDTTIILVFLSSSSELFAIFLGAWLPGLALYWLRWRQVRGRTGRGSAIVQGVFSLLHELCWAFVFHVLYAADESFTFCEVFTALYGLGALLSLVQLLIALTEYPDEQYQSVPADEQ